VDVLRRGGLRECLCRPAGRPYDYDPSGRRTGLTHPLQAALGNDPSYADGPSS